MNEEKSFARFRLAFYELYCETPMGTDIAATDNWTEIFNMMKKWIIPFYDFKIPHLIKNGFLKENFLIDYVPKSILVENGFYIDEEIDSILYKQVFLLLNCKVKRLSMHSSIVCMFDSTIEYMSFSDIHFMGGKSIVTTLNGRSTIKYMYNNSKVVVMGCDSLVYIMNDSAIIETMGRDAEVREMYARSAVKCIVEDAKIVRKQNFYEDIGDIYEDMGFMFTGETSGGTSILDNIKFNEK